ncbi:G-type lectin S-receptor-like serine/threonine-protein kinase At1g34300 [Nicotiana tomentosiformis]|uniref:G-type lectin S-receptor-like serine/threonine-protein kinase At1g34300 n=1 Tax=Nicotiana tomentosiformis TaxID=4098 RepID=UPI00051C36A5|nr:G-type lectin S-receptor-like serine/threonine-protein kinase At1g34300 [Nicotiana tomentosiformis]
MKALFFIFTIIIITIEAADILPGSTLLASDPNSKWSSPNNTFTLSFLQLDPTNQNTYFASISYNNIPIWTAGGTTVNGGAVDSSAALRFLSNGDLVLTNGPSGIVVWSSRTANLGVSSASLDENGNLVLKNGTFLNIWSTFDNPTDTIVPAQNFSKDHVLSSGLYSFKLRNNGNLSLWWNDSIVYYNSGLNSSSNVNLTSPSLSMLPIGILSLFDRSLSSPLNVVYSSDYADEGNILRFLKLDSDGNLRIYSSTQGSGTQNVRWAALTDQCQVFGYCGNFGVCSYNETGPACGCPSMNFEFNDRNDSRKGCKRKVDLSNCPSNSTMLQLDNAKFLTYPPELSEQIFSAGISACRFNCLVNGACVASTSLADGTGMCYFKQPNFVSGYQAPTLPSTSFVKICGPALPNPSAVSETVQKKNGGRVPGWVVALVVVASLLGLILLEGGLWWWCFRNSSKFASLSSQYALLEYASGAPVQFTYKELQRTTKGFKEKLGAGGFGAVYRAVLANKTVAAVKQLEGIEQGEKQFRMEVATISSTHHLNLVRLIGFCSEGRHRLLVYEFMKNGSLDKFLFAEDHSSGKLLNWEHRYNIALGTARGITYLHEECRDCIVHCDIKPENILLDENYAAKVSDFGLAKLVNPKDHRHRTLTSHVRGTRGYLAPEWLANLPITSKSDVYSYGMVLLEIVSGKRNFEVSEETSRKKYSSWAFEEFERGNTEAILDKKLSKQEMDMEQVMRAIQVSFWCIQEQPSQRPTMGKVVQMLEGVTEIDRPPAPRATEGSFAGTSLNASSTSAFSTFAASAPAPSSSSSFQTAGFQSSASAKNVDKPSSSLLHSETK